MTIEAIEKHQAPLFVTCGMYAFTDDLRRDWQQLFEHFFKLAKPEFEIDRLLNFDTGQDVLDDPAMWIGQTCGYPLMTQFRDTLTPISVPIFEIEGCDYKRYSSRIIVPENSEINALEDCRGLRAVINTSDSNSGMNVLRHSVAGYNQQGRFFSEIQTSGSHTQSLTEVADHRADIAAIDCVSYRFIEDTWPELTARVRTIGFTAKTCGLPFVIPKLRTSNGDIARITESLNRACSMLDDKQKSRLHLKGFENVGIDEYQGILDLELSAQQAGYPVLS